jgi:hypothetical protein
MVARIAARLETILTERDAAVAAQRANGSALMVVKRNLIDEAFAATQTRLVSARRSVRTIVRSAYQDGLEAGDRVNLNRPLTGREHTLLP